MKAKLFIIAGFLILVQFAKAGSPFYYESISNPSKTTDYVIGFYHTMYSVSTASDDKEYIAISGAVINSSTSSLDWNNYHMAVLLKDGQLVFNYITAATSGEYDCTFTVEPKQTRHTKFCFHTVFKPEDIKGVFLFNKSTMVAFDLAYSSNE